MKKLLRLLSRLGLKARIGVFLAVSVVLIGVPTVFVAVPALLGSDSDQEITGRESELNAADGLPQLTNNSSGNQNTPDASDIDESGDPDEDENTSETNEEIMSPADSSSPATPTTPSNPTPPAPEPSPDPDPAPSYTIPDDATIVSTSSELQSALSASVAGDTIAIRGGTYTDISYTLGKQITIIAYPDETVWLDGEYSYTHAFFLVTNSGGTRISHLNFRNYASTKNFSDKPAMVIVADSVSSGITVDNCIFRASSAIGLSIQVDNSVIQNNVFEDNDWMGLHVNNGAGILVEGNRFENNNTGGNAISGSTAAAAGAKFTFTRGGTIRNNVFINNQANGLWLDLQISDMVVTGNVASNNLRHGIYYEVSTRGTITGNTVQNNTQNGIVLSGSNNTTVMGNTLSGNGAGNILVQDDPRNTTNDTQCAAGAAYGADCDSYNNTVQSS